MLSLKELATVIFTSAESRTVDSESAPLDLKEEEVELLFQGKEQLTYREFLDYFEKNPEATVPQKTATALATLTLEHGSVEDYIYLNKPPATTKL